jgi:hypothetical protein
VTTPVWTHRVVHLFAPVNAYNYVVHIPVDKINAFFVKKGSVCGCGKVEMLAGGGLKRSAVSDRLLDHLEIHHRFPAEKININILSAV